MPRKCRFESFTFTRMKTNYFALLSFFVKESNVIGFCFFDAWGPWVDVDNPSRGGDDELLEEHRRQTDSACDNPTGMQIQFVGRTGFPTGSDIIRQSLTYGLSCRNADQPGTCKDYRVRYCCNRGK